MSDVFKVIEIVGTSPEGIDDAVKNALAEAHKTVHGIRWFEVSGLRGCVKDGAVERFHATVKIGFKIERKSQDPDR